jgi:glyoxylase-like metal-dependent hydrolase (beta-lactamase superfamily II)
VQSRNHIIALRLLLIALAACGCESERRVPYIAPTLHDWPRPYRGTAGTVLHGFVVGTRRGPERAVLRGGSLTRECELPVLAFVLAHPREGLVVIDTGLKPTGAEPSEVGAGWPWALVAELAPGHELPSQMRAAGLDPTRVRWVVLTNLRPDHAGGAKAFERARVVVSRVERQAAADRGASVADEVTSWRFVDLSEGRPLGTFAAAVDLFGDRSCFLLDARGPTVGTVAVLLRLADRPVLLAGDLAPVAETVRYAAAPAALDDAEAWWDRLWRLKRFKDLEPALLVVPGHDPTEIRSDPAIRWHEPPPVTPRAAATPTAHRPLLQPWP